MANSFLGSATCTDPSKMSSKCCKHLKREYDYLRKCKQTTKSKRNVYTKDANFSNRGSLKGKLFT